MEQNPAAEPYADMSVAYTDGKARWAAQDVLLRKEGRAVRADLTLRVAGRGVVASMAVLGRPGEPDDSVLATAHRALVAAIMPRGSRSMLDVVRWLAVTDPAFPAALVAEPARSGVKLINL